RLGFRTYNAGGNRRAHTVRPYGLPEIFTVQSAHSFRRGSPGGNSTKGGRSPPFGRFKERGLQGGEGNSKSLSLLSAFCLLCRRGQSRSPPTGGEISSGGQRPPLRRYDRDIRADDIRPYEKGGPAAALQ